MRPSEATSSNPETTCAFHPVASWTRVPDSQFHPLSFLRVQRTWTHICILYEKLIEGHDWWRGKGSRTGLRTGSRKVRAPQDMVPGNTRASRGDGKCHREQTADGGIRAVQVRVKRWGKSPPRVPETAAARQTPPGARPNRSERLSVAPELRVGRTRRRAIGVPDR